MNQHSCLLCLGSNSNRHFHMEEARKALKESFPTIRFGEEMTTEAIGDKFLSPFSNQVAKLETSLTIEGGLVMAKDQAGCPLGTTLVVRDLFYNTPARLKFMKKDSAETAAVSGLLQHLALSHPDVSFKFIKDGQETLHTPGDGKLESAIYAALGRDFARSLVPVEGKGGDVSVKGFVTQPLMGRGSRSMQVFFVNGRFIKSQLLTAALEEGYRNQIMKGKFPGCVIHLTVKLNMVDVNVHPAKLEVKFSNEKQILEKAYNEYLELKRCNLWGSKKYF